MPFLSEEDDEKSDSEDRDLDKQMGDLNGEEADKLDERLWGDDDDEEDEEEDSTIEETGPGMDEVIKRFPHHVVPRLRGGTVLTNYTHCHSLLFLSSLGFSSLSSISVFPFFLFCPGYCLCLGPKE